MKQLLITIAAVVLDGFDIFHPSSNINGIFCTAFAAVFAEEVGDFSSLFPDGVI